MKPELSVIIPFYNRADTLPLVLASVDLARKKLAVEVVLVDDGSTPPAAEQLRGQALQPDRILRQENQGLLFARLTGLRVATGEFTLFLDSDDLVGPDKFSAQLAAMRTTDTAVSYTDTTSAELHLAEQRVDVSPEVQVAQDTSDLAEFFLLVQPPPHSPIFRTDWIRAVVAQPLFPPSALYNPVAELWFYHVGTVYPGKIVKVAGAHTIVGHHSGTRLTNHWERLGVASLAVMEAFDRACPRTPALTATRARFAAKTFNSWRALPYDFDAEFDARLLRLWRQNPHGEPAAPGGPRFQMLARVIGPVRAARLFRRWQGRAYADCRTVSDPRLVSQWLAELPAT